MRDLSKLMQARIILEDGSIWHATSCGAQGEASGELVFNTALSGYQEVLTDPSYTGQVVVMTYPLIGNYGVNSEDSESDAASVSGFIVRECTEITSNYRSEESLRDYFQRQNVVALEGVDTRALTLRVREHGAMRCFLTSETLSDDELRQKLQDVPDLVGHDMVAGVTCAEAQEFNLGYPRGFEPPMPEGDSTPRRVVAFDFGAKTTIFRSLKSIGCEVIVVPASTSAEAVLAYKPDGVFLSNGPGDPRPLTGIVETVKGLLGKVPIFGICLGHQILALAVGATINKMKFGHHGSNHPVKDLDTGKVEVTAQNHGFETCADSLIKAGARVTHINLNDQTVEGFELAKLKAFSVQYHPEASPGPHDSLYLFRRFHALMASAERSASA
ncbi:MAG: carbamoyl-phosphate synthase small subunit [Planctomycetota bacterium]|jgi:carbamoyl-phosphate synthase small subunit